MDVHEGSTIDAMIEGIGLLIHESRSSKEFDIVVKMYFMESSLSAAPETYLVAWKLRSKNMRMRLDITHRQDETCMGGLGKSCVVVLQQSDLSWRFSKSKQEPHKHQKGDKKRQYVDFKLAEFWTDEEAAATSTALPNDLHLMVTVAGGLSRGHLYGAGSEAADFRAESKQTATRLPPFYLDAEQWMIMRVEAVTSSVLLLSTKR
ncbi:hypothetical protein M9H77_17885 [Catharanthus roseus]|uniref:Uncharacterized protein n=1 Tax=Catharanthus roseus TaxID=4058 RepID=A0ACC0B646_CATRO|nr:hypothetical protein M9H77_17885 [Catharanthus roseus]